MTTTPTPPPGRADARGFSLVELLMAMAITLIVMGATMTALGDAWKATDSANLITGLNTGLRVAMDVIVRDLLQVGQGLPTGRVITIPSGTGATPVRLPGPPGTTYTLPITTTELSAVIPGPGRGPVVNGRATDMITTIAADSSFEERVLTALTNSTMTVALNRAAITGPPAVQAIRKGANISDGLGDDDVEPGDLIMLSRGSFSALVQVTGVSGQVITFAAGDSLNLNQTAAADGTVREYRDLDDTATVQNEAIDPATGVLQSVATRIRMITYYIDDLTSPGRPRLVRRMNNGHPTTFNNNLGTAVAFDVENLQITYDLADGVVNPANIRMTAVDIAGSAGAPVGCPCDLERIRKVNVLLAARARQPARVSRQVYRNSLLTQVSLRSLAFVDRYE
jgi:prepilin-type N-terminal cleavage/methylation domain-containing protein